MRLAEQLLFLCVNSEITVCHAIIFILFISITIHHLAELLFTGDWARDKLAKCLELAGEKTDSGDP